MPAPEHLKRFVEGIKILPPMDEQSAKREIKIRAPANVDVTERGGNFRHPSRVDVESGRVKDAAEMKEIVKEVAHDSQPR